MWYLENLHELSALRTHCRTRAPKADIHRSRRDYETFSQNLTAAAVPDILPGRSDARDSTHACRTHIASLARRLQQRRPGTHPGIPSEVRSGEVGGFRSQLP